MTIKYTVTSPRRNPSPLLAPIAHGSQITVISALNTPTVVVPSPPAGRLRFVNPGAGYPTGGAGAMANIWWANDSGGDVEARGLFGAASLGVLGPGTIPTGTFGPGAQSFSRSGGFLMDSTEDFRVEMTLGTELKVFASWFDIDATGIGLTRLAISDTAEHVLVPPAPAGKLHALVLFTDGMVEPNGLVTNPPGGALFDVLLDDGGVPHTVVSGVDLNPFHPSGFHPRILDSASSLKVKFASAPSPDAVFAFAYRILNV